MQLRLHRFFNGRQRAVVLIVSDGLFHHDLLHGVMALVPEAASDRDHLRAVIAYFEVEGLLVAHEIVDINLQELLKGVLSLLELGFWNCKLGRV